MFTNIVHIVTKDDNTLIALTADRESFTELWAQVGDIQGVKAFVWDTKKNPRLTINRKDGKVVIE